MASLVTCASIIQVFTPDSNVSPDTAVLIKRVTSPGQIVQRLQLPADRPAYIPQRQQLVTLAPTRPVAKIDPVVLEPAPAQPRPVLIVRVREVDVVAPAEPGQLAIDENVSVPLRVAHVAPVSRALDSDLIAVVRGHASIVQVFTPVSNVTHVTQGRYSPGLGLRGPPGTTNHPVTRVNLQTRVNPGA